MTQQTRLAFLADAGNRGQLGGEVAQFAPLAMIGDCVAVCFVANHLNQAKYLRMRIEIDGLVFTAFY